MRRSRCKFASCRRASTIRCASTDKSLPQLVLIGPSQQPLKEWFMERAGPIPEARVRIADAELSRAPPAKSSAIQTLTHGFGQRDVGVGLLEKRGVSLVQKIGVQFI